MPSNRRRALLEMPGIRTGLSKRITVRAIRSGQGVNPLQMEQFAAIYADNLGILTGGMTQLA